MQESQILFSAKVISVRQRIGRRRQRMAMTVVQIVASQIARTGVRFATHARNVGGSVRTVYPWTRVAIGPERSAEQVAQSTPVDHRAGVHPNASIGPTIACFTHRRINLLQP